MKSALAFAVVGLVVSASCSGAERSVVITSLPSAAGRFPALGTLTSFDDFQRSDRSLVGDVAPSGRTYSAQGRVAPHIVNGRYVVDPAYGGAPDPTSGGAYWVFVKDELPEPPVAVAAEAVFKPGSTNSKQELVVVTSNTKPTLSQRSVQFYISPEGWAMIKVIDGRRITPPGGTGSFSPPLVEDGETRYQISMALDRPTSTVTVSFPGGKTMSWTDPDYAAFWGRQFSVQLLQTPTSGTVECTAIATGAP